MDDRDDHHSRILDAIDARVRAAEKAVKDERQWELSRTWQQEHADF